MEVAGEGCKKTSGPTSNKAGVSSPSLWTAHEQHEYHIQANEYPTHARTHTHTHAEKQHLHPINRDDLVGAKKAGDPYMGPVSVYVSQ